MATIGREAARAPLTSADINDGIVGAADLQSTLDLSSKTITLGTPTANAVTISPSSGDATLTLTSNGSQPWEVYSPDSSNDLRFKSDSTDYVTINTTGLVGIGTTSPARLLSVNSGSTQIAASFTSTSTTAARIGLVDGNTTGDNYVNVAAVGDAMALYAGAAERFRITSSGSVGIGTTSPQEPLSVQSSGQRKILATNTDFASSTTGSSFDIGFGATSGNTYTDLRALISGRSAWGDLVLQRGGGKVGIGTASPAGSLHISKSSSGSDVELRIQNSAVSSGDTATLRFSVTSNSAFDSAFVGSDRNNALILGANAAERARLTSGGDLLVGTTSEPENSGGGAGFVASSSSRRILQLATTSTSTNTLQTFNNPNGTVGSVQTSGSATSFNTSSDARLKENIADAEDAASLIDAIQVRSFDWKVDGSHQRYGMVAQELLEVAPEAVSQGETEEDMMGVDYSKLVPMLVKEIQSLRARVAQLEGA